MTRVLTLWRRLAAGCSLCSVVLIAVASSRLSAQSAPSSGASASPDANSASSARPRPGPPVLPTRPARPSVQTLAAAVGTLAISRALVSGVLDVADRLRARGAPADSVRLLLTALDRRRGDILALPFEVGPGIFGTPVTTPNSNGVGLLARLAGEELDLSDSTAALANLDAAQAADSETTSFDATLLSVLARSGRSDLAVRLSETTDGAERQVLRIAIASGLARAGRGSEALAMVRLVADREARRDALLAVAASAGRAGDIRTASAAARAAVALGLDGALTFQNIADSLCATPGPCASALSVLQASGAPPSSESAEFYRGTVVAAVAARGDLARATAIAGTRSHPKNQVVWALANRGLLAEAIALASTQHDRHAWANGLSGALQAALAQHDLPAARRMLTLLAASRLDTAIYSPLSTEALLLDLMARDGDVAGLRALPSLVRATTGVLYWAALAGASLRTGSVEAFWHALDRHAVRGGYPRVLALAVGAAVRDRAGDHDTAGELLRQATDLLRGSDDDLDESNNASMRAFGWADVAVTVAAEGDTAAAALDLGSAVHATTEMNVLQRLGAQSDIEDLLVAEQALDLVLDPDAPPQVQSIGFAMLARAF